MESFKGNALSWKLSESVIELTLHHSPANEIGRAMLAEFEQFVTVLESANSEASVLIIYSQLKSGFSAGGDLREMYALLREASPVDRAGIRDYLECSHRCLNAIDAAPLVTIAAVHGICF